MCDHMCSIPKDDIHKSIFQETLRNIPTKSFVRVTFFHLFFLRISRQVEYTVLISETS